MQPLQESVCSRCLEYEVLENAWKEVYSPTTQKVNSLLPTKSNPPGNKASRCPPLVWTGCGSSLHLQTPQPPQRSSAMSHRRSRRSLQARKHNAAQQRPHAAGAAGPAVAAAGVPTQAGGWRAAGGWQQIGRWRRLAGCEEGGGPGGDAAVQARQLAAPYRLQ